MITQLNHGPSDPMMPCGMAYTMPLTKRAQAAADINFVGHSDLVFAAAMEQARIV
jgi:hypothetical protein